jgi:GNAT superfamily N-acetyltransferase
MTSTLTRSLELRLADSTDVMTVARQHYNMWNAGLTRDGYNRFLQFQLAQPWSRRNYRYFAAWKNNEIVASVKLYTFDFVSRHQQFKVGGIGAVFTTEQHRGRGYASEMLNLVIKRARDEKYDAVLLFSDIDPSFYENLGFELLPDDDFHIWLNEPEVERYIMSGPDFVADSKTHEPDVALLTEDLIPQMVRHHRRYLERQPYGLVRSESYWQYKVRRTLYRLPFVEDVAPPELMTLNIDSNEGGYALFEQSGKILRVLEVIGSEETRDILWRNILRNGLLRRVHLFRGWDSAGPSFRQHVRYTERSDWARPMLLPINPATERWLDFDVCPLLELDHF